MKIMRPIAVLVLTGFCGLVNAQWDPFNGDWGKEDTRDLRVMTWNVQDGICSSNDKGDTFADWNGLVRIIASLQPDVLILQECGDNSGNNTGSGDDSVSELETVIDLFFHGGSDPFEGGTVGSYVQKYVPDYDLPYVFVSTNSDGFNRNVILSRYPFADINGGGSLLSNFVVIPDAYQSGGTGGIRGFQFAEIDLPDNDYAGDLVVGNAHLKAGGSSSDYEQREIAALNTAYFIDYYYNGAGTGMSDPNGRVAVPAVGNVLDDNTPVIWGGDLNQTPSSSSPNWIMTRAEFSGGSDGTDRDRSDASFSNPSHPISGDTSTQGSSSRLDYLCWQDSIAQVRRQFIFRSSGSNMNVSRIPYPASTFPVNPTSVSSLASDHRPVIVDFILPAAPDDPCPSPPDFIDDDQLDFFDVSAFLAAFSNSENSADINGDGNFDFFDVSGFLAAFSAGCP
ncbi:MAG: endonuclease/exonuclease/phosphatase family protein [Phycisphaerales bacterium JB047]